MTGTPLEPVRICASEDLVDGGDGVRHKAVDKGGEATVFFVRYDGKPFGHLHGHVGAAVEIAKGFAVVSDEKHGGLATFVDGFMTNAVATVDQILRCANSDRLKWRSCHAFSRSQSPSDVTFSATNSGSSACSDFAGCAPYVTPTAAAPAFFAICRSCVVSPIITVRLTSCPSSRVSSCSMAGCGLEKVSSAHRVPSKRLVRRDWSSARFRPTRLLPVATASR